jgi:gluconokinase
MPGTALIVGLDVGTTSVKAVAFQPGSARRHVATRQYPTDEPAPGCRTQDPEVIVAAALAALAECVAAGDGAAVAAVSLSAAMHGLMALDADLRPLTPLVTWADARAADEARSLRESGDAAQLHNVTGVPVHPMTPLAKLMWFARHQPETWAAARWWIGLKDYLIYRLTGTLATELSSASGTGLLEMATRAWSPGALAVCGVPAERLPEILSPTTVLELAPAASEEVGLPAGTPVVVGAGDGPLGNLGTGAITPGVAGLTLGTSGALRLAFDRPRLGAGRALYCYALTESLWVSGGSISNGGGVIPWAGRALAPDLVAAGDDPDAAVLELAAQAPPGADGLAMVPYLIAERAPLWDPDLAGAYLGLRAHHTRAHLVRAAVEGVCMQLRFILDRLDAMVFVESVRATGGAFRSPLWREAVAASLDRPLFVVDDTAGTARGAAALGLLATGRAASLDEALAQLPGDDTAAPSPVGVSRDLVATYAALRRSLSPLIDDLGTVAGLPRHSTAR